MTALELLQKYVAGERDFRGVNLSKANLAGANLTNANLEGAYLTGANLLGAYISGINLNKTILVNVNLEGANLEGANLNNVDFAYANIRSANLNGATLENSNIRNCLGNGREIQTLIGRYHICWTKDLMSIGCQQHSISEWDSFDDYEIAEMDEGALEWWKIWKPRLAALGVFENVIK